MTKTIKLDASGVLQVTLAGPITISTVLDVIEHQWRVLVRKCFWDLSAAQINQVSALQIQRIARHVDDNRPVEYIPGVSAFLVARDVDYGMMQMVKAYSDNLGFEIKISKDRTELEHWLQVFDVESD